MKINLKGGNKIGKWKLISSIKSSANGEIFICENKEGNRKVIKVCKKITQKAFYRFEIEIKSLKLASDLSNVINIIDCRLPPKELTDDLKNIPFYVMEKGTDFLKYLADKPILKRIEFILIIAYSLYQLHEKKIYHRDIKPSNIIVINDLPFLIDFGISKIPRKVDLTGNNAIGPRFTMAPEVKVVDRDQRKLLNWGKADTYSIAITLWICLTNEQKGFEGQYSIDSSVALKNYITDENIYLLDDLLLQATKLDPKRRISIEEFIKLLLKWYNLNEKYLPTKSLQWEFCLNKIFNFNIPINSTWTNTVGIYEILNLLTLSEGLSHMSLPTGGGTDLKGVKIKSDKEIELITVDNEQHSLFPKSLEFHSFKNKKSRQYFLLRIKKRKKLTVDNSEDSKYYQWLLEDLDDGQIYGNLDYKNINNLSRYKEICYWVDGLIMITGKANIMNQSGLNYLGFGKKHDSKSIKKRFKRLFDK